MATASSKSVRSSAVSRDLFNAADVGPTQRAIRLLSSRPKEFHVIKERVLQLEAAKADELLIKAKRICQEGGNALVASMWSKALPDKVDVVKYTRSELYAIFVVAYGIFQFGEDILRDADNSSRDLTIEGGGQSEPEEPLPSLRFHYYTKSTAPSVSSKVRGDIRNAMGRFSVQRIRAKELHSLLLDALTLLIDTADADLRILPKRDSERIRQAVSDLQKESVQVQLANCGLEGKWFYNEWRTFAKLLQAQDKRTLWDLRRDRKPLQVQSLMKEVGQQGDAEQEETESELVSACEDQDQSQKEESDETCSCTGSNGSTTDSDNDSWNLPASITVTHDLATEAKNRAARARAWTPSDLRIGPKGGVYYINANGNRTSIRPSDPVAVMAKAAADRDPRQEQK